MNFLDLAYWNIFSSIFPRYQKCKPYYIDTDQRKPKIIKYHLIYEKIIKIQKPNYICHQITVDTVFQSRSILFLSFWQIPIDSDIWEHRMQRDWRRTTAFLCYLKDPRKLWIQSYYVLLNYGISNILQCLEVSSELHHTGFFC